MKSHCIKVHLFYKILHLSFKNEYDCPLLWHATKIKPPPPKKTAAQPLLNHPIDFCKKYD